MSRITLKEYAALVSSLRLAAQNVTNTNTLKSRYKDASLTGANKPAGYAADEEYTRLNKLGPIVDELVDGLKAVEDEIQNIHQYIEGQLGREADRMVLPPTLAFRDTVGNLYEILTFNEATGVSQLNADEVFVGANSLYVNNKKVISDDSDTINITTDAGQNLTIKTLGSGILQISSENGGIQFTSVGGTTFNSNITVNSANSISGSNATTGLQLGKTTINGNLLMDGDIILSNQQKIAFGGDATNTYISANTDSPEDLEIHADQDVILRPDNNVVVNSVAVIDVNGNWIGPNSGLVGPTGAQGAAGANGAQGAAGLQGPTGPTGAQGAAGSTGPTGAQGAPGINGANGAQGATGAQGAVGLQGSTGPAGADGFSGTSGINGAQGAAGAQGAVGSTGAQGSLGPAGVDGMSGTSGVDGTSGTSGTSGLDGAIGTSGTSGFNGAQGSQGATGAQGSIGSDGASGTAGTSGTSGIGIPPGGFNGIFTIPGNPPGQQNLTFTNGVLTGIS